MRATVSVMMIFGAMAMLFAGRSSGANGGSAPVRAERMEVSVAEFTPADAPAVTPRYECSRVEQPIVIDGDLSEWVNIPAVVLDNAKFSRNSSGKWAGPQDCSGSMRMCWDSNFLYLAFDVTDDVFHQACAGREIWGGDCVQFAFDPLSERTKGELAPGGQECAVAIALGSPLLWNYSSSGPMKSAKVAAVRKNDSGGAIYEIGIPWSEVSPLSPGMMKAFGFTFTINDSDGGSGLKNWLQWTPGICGGKDASAFGQAVFTYVPPAAGSAESYISPCIPSKLDADSLRFRILRVTPGEEKLQVKLTLASDGKEVATSNLAMMVAPGVNRREVTWKVSGLADGSYKGTISVEPPSGPQVERNFSYERMTTGPIRAKVEAVKLKARRLADTQTAMYRENAASINYRLEAIDTRLAAACDVKTWRRLAELVAETDEILDATSRGTDWFANARGRFTRTYVAPEDDTPQPFRVSVPPDYDGSKPYPLIIGLHGYGGDKVTLEDWCVNHSAGEPGEVRPGYLVANPYGRGNTGWRGWGRNDVFHVIDEMKKRYKIDDNRVYVTGFSMGGSGTWYLATHYPDLWAAASPQSGVVGLGEWRRYANNKDAEISLRAKLAVADSEMFVIENLLNVPVVAWHGIGDGGVDVENTEAAFGRLRKLGYEAMLMEGVRQGHNIPMVCRNAAYDWILTFNRDTDPERVVYRTFDLRYNRAYWVEIDELIEDYRMSEVTAAWQGPGIIVIDTKNISRLTISLPEARLKDTKSLRVVINGDAVLVNDIPKDRLLHLASEDGGESWSASAQRYRAGCIKKHGVSGPMSDALGERFLIVYGTTGSDNATAVNRAEAEAFAKNIKGLTWGRMWGTFKVIPDKALSAADVCGANLVLFGGPESNAFTSKIAAALPVSAEAGKLTFRGKVYDDPAAAVKFIYPNPEAPGRYVIVHCGASPEAIRDIARLAVGEQPDWLLFYSTATRPVAGGNSARQADGGFFSRDWK